MIKCQKIGTDSEQYLYLTGKVHRAREGDERVHTNRADYSHARITLRHNSSVHGGAPTIYPKKT
jgi:hypothetical protein